MHKSLFLLFAASTILFAHKVNLFITQENKMVSIYSYFASKEPCKGCKIIIKEGQKTVLEDHLNGEGKYKYPANQEKLTIIVDASSGHKVEKEITVQTIPLQNLEEVLTQEENKKYLNMALALGLMALFFYLLKRIKRYAK